MPVSGLSATTEFARPVGRRAPERHAGSDGADKGEPAPPPPEPAPSEPSYDAAFYASRFKADVSRLKEFGVASEAPSDFDAQADGSLFDFFGNLSALLVAVRAGDIERAKAAADALEMEVLIERSAGRRAGASAPDDPGRRLSPPLPEEPAPRQVGAEFRDALLRLPVTPVATRAADDGGAAYETLAHYLDGDPAIG